MLIPLGDDNSDRLTRPFLTYAIIAANVLVFVLFQGCGANQKFTYAFSTVPQEILSGQDQVTSGEVLKDEQSGESFRMPDLEKTPLSVYITLFTSMFMHAGLMHLLGNMLFLFIFGDNLEDRMGRFKFLIFYLLCGALASLAHVFSSSMFHQNLMIPSLGASGAISGVLAGYLVLFPRKRVRVLIVRFITEVPAIAAIGLWFLFQVINGLGVLGSGSGGGVAYGAHIGGFLAGLVLVKLFDSGVRA